MASSKQLVSCYDGTHVRVGATLQRVDRGGVVPDGADEEHVKLLLERGMLEEGEPVSGFVDAPEATAPFSTDEVGEDDGGGSGTAKSGSKAKSGSS